MTDTETIALVEQVQSAVTADTVDLRRVVQALSSLLQHLCTPEGRTDGNCRFVDSFFNQHDEWANCKLPDVLHDIFADMSGALHDARSAPDIAQNFDSTPEQLLERLNGISIEQLGSANSDPAGGCG